jgi:hypothetical protein
MLVTQLLLGLPPREFGRRQATIVPMSQSGIV